MTAIFEATEAVLTSIIAFPELLSQYPLTGKFITVLLFVAGAFLASMTSKNITKEAWKGAWND